ncbi:MAG: TIGR01459 family HAD-type hydrolase [Actinomycetota bacterium]
MIRPAWLDGVAALAGAYDAFVVDLWGVLHDGHAAYPGAAEALAGLKAAGKRVVLLSNAPRRAQALVEAMAAMGIGRELYDDVMSSGEAVHAELAARTDPFYANLGARFVLIGCDRDRSLWDGLDLARADVDDADFILNSGPCDPDDTVADWQPLLDRAAARGLPMVCANPDHVVVRDGVRMICAGALADHYVDMGGMVSARGKPDPAIYDLALARVGSPDRSRVCAIGDGLHTDVQGALNAGLDAVLVTGGIHAAELGTEWGDVPDPARLDEVIRFHGAVPKAAMAKFVW